MDQTTRREFVSKAGTAVAVLGGATLAAAPASAAQGASPFQPARHPQDEWLDQIPGKHRVIIDAVSPKGAGEAIAFANNLYLANKSGYDLGDADLAIVICMRHFATPFAFGDPFWAKYGKMTGGMLKFDDPKTKQPPVRNVYLSADAAGESASMGTLLSDVLKRGTHVAICDMASHFFAGEAAKATGSTPDAVYKEFVAAAVPNSHFVSAGVVGVTRAQEHGYTLIYAG